MSPKKSDELEESIESSIADDYANMFGQTWAFPLINKHAYLVFVGVGDENQIYTQDIDLLIAYLQTARKAHLAKANWEIYEDK